MRKVINEQEQDGSTFRPAFWWAANMTDIEWSAAVTSAIRADSVAPKPRPPAGTPATSDRQCRTRLHCLQLHNLCNGCTNMAHIIIMGIKLKVQ